MEKTLYYNGNILTMEDQEVAPYGIYVEDGIIQGLLNKEECRALKVKQVDLKGKTLMPAFIDSHSHITGLATSLRFVSLSKAKNFQEIMDLLQKTKEERKIKNQDWLIGFGYDHNLLKEKKHPEIEQLDHYFPNNPVILSHVSGHMGVVNSLALKLLAISIETKIEGGLIGIKEGQLSGYLEENAFLSLSSKTPQPSEEEMLNLLVKAQAIYLSYGITTIQDGFVKEIEFSLLKKASQEKLLIADIMAYVDIKNNRSLYQKNQEYHESLNGLKLAGYKMFLDGSPQGKTAWISQPYENEKEGYRGYPIYRDDEVATMIEQSLQDKVQLLTHCNGDEAARQYLDCFNQVLHQNHYDDTYRPVMIHAQLLRVDQLKQLQDLKMIPSFFVAHVFHWGDTHLLNLASRANKISPLHSAQVRDIPFTLHQDTPVIPPNMLETIWCAVKRQTRSGVILGEEERITPLEALKGVTINAAHQYFQEDSKGSLKVGKIADLVILSDNPLTVEMDKIKEIQVLQTIKNGKVEYQKEGFELN